MKIFIIIAATIWGTSFAQAEFSFLDDAPKGFIHIQYESKSKSHRADTYVSASKIVSVEVVSVETEKNKGVTVLVRTVGQKGEDGLCYQIDFKNRTDALKCAQRIMAITTAKE